MGFLTPYYLVPDEWTDEIRLHSESITKHLATLGADLPDALALELANSLEVINSYYSNRMEGNPTKIGDVFDAAVNAISSSPTQRNYQLEHRAHIQVSEFIRNYLHHHPDASCTARPFLKEIHRRFYQALPEAIRFATAVSGEKVPIEPGQWRRLSATVGRFHPPAPEQIESCMEEFEQAYGRSRAPTQNVLPLLTAAHHRFLWVHPFGDGNGRVVRLLTEAMAIQWGLEGRNLYSISRGLARQRPEYDAMLAHADQPRQGDLDGRGNLSRGGLLKFTEFFLRTMEDQILFMGELFKLPMLQKKFDHYLAVERTKRALSLSEMKVLQWIFRWGPLRRGDIQKAAGVQRRQASKIAARLLSLDIVQSDSPKGLLRLRINRSLAQVLLSEFFEN